MFVKHHNQTTLTSSAQARYQRGVSLVEVMISLALSLIVTSAMISLMANSLGAATRVIQMSQLTDELRNAMGMMSRDVRRANFSASSIYCYGNSDCGIDGSATQAADIMINASNDCLIFGLDRNWDGDASNDDAGGFRRATVGSIGVVEMWVGDSSPNCASANDDWVAVTDPDFVDITIFTIDDDASFTQTISQGESGTPLTQRMRQIRMQIEGELIRDDRIFRRIEDTIRVRNDLLFEL